MKKRKAGKKMKPWVLGWAVISETTGKCVSTVITPRPLASVLLPGERWARVEAHEVRELPTKRKAKR